MLARKCRQALITAFTSILFALNEQTFNALTEIKKKQLALCGETKREGVEERLHNHSTS